MILFCGIPSESPMRLAVEAAEALDVPYVFFNQRESQHADLRVELCAGQSDGALHVHNADWPLRAFTGVLVRLMDCQALPENRCNDRAPANPDAVAKSFLVHEMLVDWLELAECRVLNRASAMRSNTSKPYQAQLIASAGFATPPTLVTNDPDEVRRFQRAFGQVVFKSISSVRSVVRQLDAEQLQRLERVRYLPTQFQAFIPGTNVRVHVVGEQLFATEIRSEAVDYRYASHDGLDVDMAPVELPAEIATRCVELSRLLDLPLCGIDLKRTPAGVYYCFEVNPSPAYSYYQEQSGQDIATAIVSYLAAR